MGPADVVAASVCYLARWRSANEEATPQKLAERVSYYHPVHCRFCSSSAKDLLEIARRGPDAGTLAEWSRLSHAARLARIREAQAPPWWEEVIENADALTTDGGAS